MSRLPWEADGDLSRCIASRDLSPPAILASVSGHLDDYPHAFYNDAVYDKPLIDSQHLRDSAGGVTSRSGTASQFRSVSGPASSYQHALNSARSTSALLPSRQAGTVRDIASRLNHGDYVSRQPPPPTALPQHEGHRSPPKYRTTRQHSPARTPGAKGEHSKLQKRRPSRTRSPQKARPAATSFETVSSLSSGSTITSSKSQPHTALLPKPLYDSIRPLFGEITSDGHFHGNFDLTSYEQVYAQASQPIPTFRTASRRQSESSLALSHDRSQLYPKVTSSRLSPRERQQAVHHERSRSDMDASSSPSMPIMNQHTNPALYPTPPNSGTRNVMQKGGRIPVRSSRNGSDGNASWAVPHSRPASALASTSDRRRLSRSPSRKPVGTKEDATPTAIPRINRYQPPPIVTAQTNQTLSAKIVAPLPKASPPLRSSRPRQPVSSATTASTRAKAADRFQDPKTRDGRRPSEQWLGKPYDRTEHSRRRIPELEKVDFAARREKVKQAMMEHTAQSRAEEEYARSRSRASSGQYSHGHRPVSHLSDAGTEEPMPEDGMQNDVDRHQADEMNMETDDMGLAYTPGLGEHSRGLSLQTSAVPDRLEAEPLTAATEFEESPILGYPPRRQKTSTEDRPTLLTSAIYQPRSTAADAPPPIEVHHADSLQALLGGAASIRKRSLSSVSKDGTEFGEDSPAASAVDSASDIEDRWGLHRSLTGDHGSIRIMLGDEPTSGAHAGSWSKNLNGDLQDIRTNAGDEVAHPREYDQYAHAATSYLESPVDHHERFASDSVHDTPRERRSQEDTLKPTVFQPTTERSSLAPHSAIAHALDHYESTGTIPPELLLQMDAHMVDLHRMSANGGSDAIMVQSLLDSIITARSQRPQTPSKEMLQATQYVIPPITPDTPPGAATGTAVVFGIGRHNGTGEAQQGDEDEFEARIRQADEDWAQQQHDEDNVITADAPPPPPKDNGYTPRLSLGLDELLTFPVNLTTEGLRISTLGALNPEDAYLASHSAGNPNDKQKASALAVPPAPGHAPPIPPPEITLKLPFGRPEVPQSPIPHLERRSSDLSPRVRRNIWGPSPGSSRPSIDSERAPGEAPLPGSVSMSSLANSTRQSSVDIDATTKLAKITSPGPEQKRLLKRRHIIKELLDTENTYHQDLKIIEDIYKATVADLVSAEDKKALFGNCDEIERFSLQFYDELRKAVHTVYVPPKQMRWANKRGSYSTLQSDGTGQVSTLASSTSSNDLVDDERDRTTTVGQTFLSNIAQMDQVYGSYLKNHDAANQRLSALKDLPNVKCWLDECHNNASDITSAWDLDSLLVKPTQRVSKYPMLLQQLLETTPADHPDHGALQAAAKDSVTMLTRINEAKKRADIVDQIINRKGKDNDVRSGLAKAFGRRTEKLKERVGIAEAFQDVEFDELAHKFGGHYIRLQICMRDVQDYVHRIDKSMEQMTACAAALEFFTDVSPSSLPEIESKWRRYGQVIRDLMGVAFPEHKAAVQRRVIDPMITCIKLHEGPQSAISQRKKRIVDYAKCKSIEKRGEKPDKKTTEASEMYMALNDHLKMELPSLYSLTGTLVQSCLNCFLDIQLTWYNTWERKLRTTIDAIDIPSSIQHIEPAFRSDYDLIELKLAELAICNGALLADSIKFLSPATTFVGELDQSSSRRPSGLDSNRTLSIGSEISHVTSPLHKRHSSGVGPTYDTTLRAAESRVRSSSSLSMRGPAAHQTPPLLSMSANRPWSNHSGVTTPTSSFTSSRPATANAPMAEPAPAAYPLSHLGDEYYRQRPSSGNTFVTARPEQTSENHRFSDVFHSAMPPGDSPSGPQPHREDAAPTPRVMFVCASLFEFSIDRTRKEGGYPYLTYASGEVFDVVGQKGELWLAKNQDDRSNTLGWIWEQHFVILSTGE